LEQWRLVPRTVEEPQKFFKLPEDTARQHLARLAKALADECKQYDTLFKVSTIDELRKISSKLDGLLPQPKPAPQEFVQKRLYPEIDQYLPRKICAMKDYSSSRLLFVKDELAKDILAVISDCKRVALLGDAGLGKTIELNRVASKLSKKESQFYPVLIPLNKYVANQSISELLLTEYKSVPKDILVVILDGLDEIESKNKNDAIRQIEIFADQSPKTRIIISCRRNFYDSETEQFSGTLSGFSSFVLLELGGKEIEEYIDRVLKQKAARFNEAISQNRLYELLRIPFYLIRLAELFESKGTLPSHKADIFEQLLFERIKLDVEHFRTTKELVRKRQTIIQTLQRLALGMEVLGRNYVTDDEYSQIIPEDCLRSLIEHCTIWKKDESENIKWQFEHNNFQEYLAAKLLSNKPIAILKEFMFFKPQHNKLIPSWSNTLSFLISISQNQELIQWIIDNEPELVVKFEPDRVGIDIRIKIFKEIFNTYKVKQIWINRDKFRDDELAKFGQSDEIVEFLLLEAKNANHYTTISNAIELLSNMEIPESKKVNTSNILSNFALTTNFGSMVQNRAIIALADLKLYTPEITKKIVNELRTSTNEWIRYALYYFLHSSNQLDENINVFLEGIKYTRFDISSERGRLINESIELRLGLEKAKSPIAIINIFKYFTTHPEDLRGPSFEESIEVIAKNAANIYSGDEILFQTAVNLLEILAKNHLGGIVNQLVTFFDKINKRLELFMKYLSQEKKDYEQWIILAFLADKSCLDVFIQEYESGNIKDDDVFIFRNSLSLANSPLYSTFNDLINAKTGNKFHLPPQRDYQKESQRRVQKDFDLLFDKNAFLNEIKLIYDTEKKEYFTQQEIWDIQRTHWENPYFSETAIRELSNIAAKQPISFDDAVKIIDKWDWSKFCMHHIYETLHSSSKVVLTDIQRGVIADWCDSNLSKVNFKTALASESDGSTSSSYSAIFLWFFLRKLSLTYPEPVLLDLLSYDWSRVGIDYLENLLDEKKITSRILSNLRDGIKNDQVLENHLNYCKKHRLKDVVSYALNELAKPDRDESVKRIALDTICELSDSATSDLEKILPHIKNGFKWDIINKLVANNSEECHKYLLSILKTGSEDEKLRSADYLTEFRDSNGLQYYVDWVKKYKKSPWSSHSEHSQLLKLQNKEAVPYLTELLKESYQPGFKDEYGFFGHYILNTLTAISLQSEDNYRIVRKTIEDFITANKEQLQNVNFLNIFIEKLDQQYYTTKSEKLTIDEVIERLRLIST
jgi:predicted NACHT family NTPase